MASQPVPEYQPHRKNRTGHYIAVILLILAALFFLMPVYVMVINGLKDKSYMTLGDMWKLPRDLSGGGFPVAWQTISPNLLATFRIVIPAAGVYVAWAQVNHAGTELYVPFWFEVK